MLAILEAVTLLLAPQCHRNTSIYYIKNRQPLQLCLYIKELVYAFKVYEL